MTSRLILHMAGAACAALLLVGAAIAKPVTVVPGDKPITVDIPGSWTVSEITRGIEAKTADDEVYVWFESYRPSQLEKIIVEHNAYYKDQGVKITGEAKATQKEFSTYFLKFTEYPATYEGGPTVLRYISVVPKVEGIRHLLVTYWASPDGDKEYDGEVSKMMQSLGVSYDGM